MLRKRIALPLPLAAGLLGSLALVVPAEASHSWGGYHWARASNPFTLQVGNNVTGTWTTHFNTAVADWSDSDPDPVNVVASSILNLQPASGTSNKRCSMVAGTVQVCNGTYGRNGWLGLASINITGGTHITQGSAKMNDTYFNTSTYNNPNEKLHVMCQEIGHTFGLDHQSTGAGSLDTCMDYFSNTGTAAESTLSTHPNQHDYDQLAAVYAHTESSSTVAASASSSTGREVGDDRSTWGREIARGANGEFSVFERDFGNGDKVITHVTWALDAPAGRSGA